ncbi:hypothetical protein BX667DRAFT_522734 [Coemansia mojavensis]|nr:hypothetical protein BX667DRAFT_522734 [Coemansia mojavensis]
MYKSLDTKQQNVKRWRIAAGVLLALSLLVLLYKGSSYSPTVEVKESKVLVELFVMSRCPDAIKVERVFDGVVPQVYSIMDLQLNFIGQLDPHSTYGVKCKHGNDECRGNIDQLCALAHNKDLAMFWQFLSCLNKNPRMIGRGEEALKCASLAGLDSAFYTCVSSGEGRQLLEQSVENSQFIGVNTSATVFINGKPRCVEDAGWREYLCGLQGFPSINLL